LYICNPHVTTFAIYINNLSKVYSVKFEMNLSVNYFVTSLENHFYVLFPVIFLAVKCFVFNCKVGAMGVPFLSLKVQFHQMLVEIRP
jgi:hypothetical protein